MEKSLKSKIVSIALIAMLCISALLSIFFAPFTVQIARGEDGANGLRFMQVSLGEDFAIGLTYDGDIYGWNFAPGTNALGVEYSVNPQKIPVTFVRGPKSSNNIDVTMDYTPLSPNEEQDRILKVATTRSSAAFITEKGHIYTWGHNYINMNDDTSNSAYGILLQKDAINSSYVSRVPTMIDYATAETNLAQLKALVPLVAVDNVEGEMTNENGNLLDIVGGDDNYVVKHYRQIGGTKKIFYFGWGSNKYLTTNSPTSVSSLRAQMYDFTTPSTNSSDVSLDTNALMQNVSVGGGTVLIADDNDIYVRGKNFYIPTDGNYVYNAGETKYTTSVGVGEDNDPIKVLYPEKLLDLVPTKQNASSADRDEVDEQKNGAWIDASKSGRYSPYTWTSTSLYIKSTLDSNETVYAFDEAFAANNSLGNYPYEFYAADKNGITSIAPAQNNVKFRNSTSEIGKNVYVDTMSVGNGYGYVIHGNYLYFFGNGYNGQSGQADASTKKAYSAITQIPAGAFDGVPVSVVAGKTKMGRPLFTETENGTEGSFNATGRLELTTSGSDVQANFAEGFRDGTEFLSGMTTTKDNVGDVYVWSNRTGFTSLKEQLKNEFGIDGSAENRIIRLAGGYGNHLVALSSVGKIYQISYDTVNSQYKIELKDVFVDESGKVQKNYGLNNANEINFLMSTGRPSTKAEESGFDYSLNAVIDLTSKTDSEQGVSDDKYSDVIVDNISGDAFRMLTSDDKNLPHRSISKSNALVSKPSENIPDNGTPKFFFDDGKRTPISSEILAHYLSYRTISDNGTGGTGKVSIEITPYQSTGNTAIIMQYYIGRYRSDADTLASHDADYLFYDFDVVETKITIANTQAEFNKFDNRLKGEKSNISIPVLDPNNANNKTYSIALTNVQYGLDKLAEYFGVGANADKFSEYVVEQAYAKDAGFPAKKRVEDAHLERYYEDGGTDPNYSADSYFTDSYKYFVFDTDGDDIKFFNKTEPYSGTRNYFSCSPTTIEFDIPINNASLGFQLDGITTDASTLDQYNAKLRNFNNIYGFTATVAEKGSDLVLHIAYDVVQFTAISSTNNLVYVNNDIAKPNMTEGIDALPRYGLYFSETYYDRESGENIEAYNDDEIAVPAYIQSSLMINGVDESNNPIVYRAEEGHNVYNVNVPARTVGSSTSKYVFSLNRSGLFSDFTNIYLTQKSRTTENKYDEWKEFTDQFDKKITNVTLTRNEFTFEAFVPGTYNDIKIEVRRFATSSMDTPIQTRDKSGKLVDEIITLVFNINVVKSSFESNGLKEFNSDTITSEKVYPISTFTNEPDTSYVSASSSNESVAIVKISSDGQNLTVTPRASGTVLIEVYIKQYGRPIEAYFTLNVQSRSEMEGTLSLNDSKKYYLSDLKAVIAKTYNGDFKFEDFVIDKDNTELAPDGYYFVERAVGESNWTPIKGLPSFISSVVINKDDNNENDNDVVLSLGQYDEESIANKEFMFVVKFKGINTSDGQRFETGIKLRPAKMVLVDKETNNEFVINVNVNHGRVVIDDGLGYAANKDTEYRVKLLDILNKYAPSMEGRSSFNIQFAKPMYEDAFNYFDVYNVANDLVIKPLKNTVSEQLVNVLIMNESENYVLSFKVVVGGIIETLPVATYRNIWIICAIVVFVLMFIIFMIRMGIYWKKKAEQKRIIRKNQMLIKMRDKVHNKSDSISKEQLVQTKLKLQDPKYAKMFNEMKKAQQKRDGINLDDDADGGKKSKKKKDKKKKQSLAEMKAELEARKEANAKMQMGEQIPLSDIPVEPTFGEPVEAMTFGAFDVPTDGVSDAQMSDKINSDDNILFDVETLDDNK